MGPGACRAIFHGALGAKKNLSSEMPSAIFIYRSAPQPPPPVCQPGPAEPPSPSGHTSLLLTPVTTCPSLAPQRSPPRTPAIRPARGHDDLLTGTSGHAHVCFHRHLTGRPWAGVSTPKPRAGRGGCLWPPFSRGSFPACQSLGSAGLSPESSTSHRLGPLGGVPTLKCRTNWPSWGDGRRRGRDQDSGDGGLSQACGQHAAGQTFPPPPPHHSLKESGEPQSVFQGAVSIRGVCMLEGRPPPVHPAKRATTEYGTRKRQ